MFSWKTHISMYPSNIGPEGGSTLRNSQRRYSNFSLRLGLVVMLSHADGQPSGEGQQIYHPTNTNQQPFFTFNPGCCQHPGC